MRFSCFNSVVESLIERIDAKKTDSNYVVFSVLVDLCPSGCWAKPGFKYF